MSRTVFIFGAGASREGGGPLMADFLDTADKLRRKGVGNAQESFDLVFRALGALDASHAKSKLDVDNMESVFGAFEFARLSGRLGSLSDTDVENLNRSMRRLIVTTLEKSLIYPVNDKSVRAPRPYHDFAQILAWKIHGSELGPISFITFNYDLALDFMIYSSREEVDYCFSNEAGKGIPVMKLHGSMNWARCAKCLAVLPWHLSAFFKQFSWESVWFGDLNSVNLEVGAKLTQYQHCAQPCEPDPLIVPPTWNKAEYGQDSEITNVWKHADRHLAEAENFIVVGYSLPDTDQFFRYLYALGTIGNARIKRFWVVNPSTEVADRFSALLGPTARARFHHFPMGFADAIHKIREKLGLA